MSYTNFFNTLMGVMVLNLALSLLWRDVYYRELNIQLFLIGAVLLAPFMIWCDRFEPYNIWLAVLIVSGYQAVWFTILDGCTNHKYRDITIMSLLSFLSFILTCFGMIIYAIKY